MLAEMFARLEYKKIEAKDCHRVGNNFQNQMRREEAEVVVMVMNMKVAMHN